MSDLFLGQVTKSVILFPLRRAKPRLAWVFGMLGVPLGHQVIGRLADVSPIGDVADERPRSIEAVLDRLVQAMRGPELAVQSDLGQIRPQLHQFHALSLTVEERDGVAELLQDHLHLALVKPRAARDVADQSR